MMKNKVMDAIVTSTMAKACLLQPTKDSDHNINNKVRGEPEDK